MLKNIIIYVVIYLYLLFPLLSSFLRLESRLLSESDVLLSEDDSFFTFTSWVVSFLEDDEEWDSGLLLLDRFSLDLEEDFSAEFSERESLGSLPFDVSRLPSLLLDTFGFWTGASSVDSFFYHWGWSSTVRRWRCFIWFTTTALTAWWKFWSFCWYCWWSWVLYWRGRYFHRLNFYGSILWLCLFSSRATATFIFSWFCLGWLFRVADFFVKFLLSN